MSTRKVWYAPNKFESYGEEEIRAVEACLRDGWLAGFGPRSVEFEEKIAKRFGKKYGVFVNSGSSANLVSMTALKKRFNWQDDDEIIVSPVGFATTISVIHQNRLKPVFIDIEWETLNFDLNQIEDKITPRTKAIFVSPVLGNPPDMDRLMEIVKKYELIYLEDTCDALGSTWDGKPLGSFGDISTCSFFPAHHMTMGEGGFVAVNSAKKRMALASLRDWGRACYCNTAKPGNVMTGTACGCRFDSWFKEEQDIIFDHRYVFEEIGYNLKPTEMQAAMGLAQIKKLDEMHARRKHNFERLYNIFSKYEQYFYLPTKHEKADTSWFGYLVTLKDGTPFTKAEMVDWMEGSKIQTRSYFTGNALFHPAYEKLREDYSDPRNQFPVATKTTLNTFFLGVYPGITDEQLDYIEKTVDEFIKSK